jgi:hypothetical protein
MKRTTTKFGASSDDFFCLTSLSLDRCFCCQERWGVPVEKKSHHPILWLEHDDKKIYEEYIKYI